MHGTQQLFSCLANKVQMTTSQATCPFFHKPYNQNLIKCQHDIQDIYILLFVEYAFQNKNENPYKTKSKHNFSFCTKRLVDKLISCTP